MSLMHRSPQRVKYLTAKAKEHEESVINPAFREKYEALCDPNDPFRYEDWLVEKGPIDPRLALPAP